MTDARRVAAAVEHGVRTVCCPTGLRGTARELAWVAAHLATYPLGLAQERTGCDDRRHRIDSLPPLQRALLIGDVEAAGTPIVLVHGFIDNRSIFALLRRQLRRRGFGRVVTFDYGLRTDLRAAAARLGEAVERLADETGFERVHVVGHSLGGLVARYYVQRLGGDARVHTLVTLGSPHAGTRTARLLPHHVCRQLRPGSEVVHELAAPAPGCRTRFVAYWSDLDQLIVPARAARLEHPDLDARNVLVRGVGHMSLPIDRRIVRDLCTTLAHVDASGSTVAAGVTPLAGRRPARGGRPDKLPEKAATHRRA